MCQTTEISMEPLLGGGVFQVKSGLYFDEHLVQPVDRNIKNDDRIGFFFDCLGLNLNHF